MKPKILLDIDGVIANFYHGFASYLNDKYNCTLDVNVEPKNYSFEKWGHGVENVNFDISSNEWINQDGFEKLPAFEGAEKFVKQLINMCDVCIVTARIGDWNQKFGPGMKNRIKRNTYNWLKRHNMPVDKLHFIHEKIPFCKERGISIMIEDKMDTALEASKNGMHTILMNRGYNGSQIDWFRIYRVYNFNKVLDQIRKLNK